MLRRVLALCVLLAAPPLAGCVALPAIFLESIGEGVTPPVDEDLNAFNQDLRWGRIQQAAQQMPEEKREAFVALFDAEEPPFRFTSIEVLSATPKGIDGREVDVLVAWEYYTPPGLTERKLRQKQQWRFVPIERRWEVVPDLSGFEAAAASAKAPVSAPARDAAVPASPQR
jgi:hypothetical protein